MGLDMYAFTVKSGKDLDDESRQEISYWRKFNALHGWMKQYWLDQGNEGEFNCVPVLLDESALTSLEVAAKNRTLQPVHGFFFGSQEPLEDGDFDAILDFVYKAKREIAVGNDVYYDSWW